MDGCRAGWVAAVAPADVSQVRLVVVASLQEFAEQHPGLQHWALDMPVDLPRGKPDDDGLRRCDEQARAKLGWPRSSSVFSAPPVGVLAASDHAEACEIAAAASERKISVQAWNLVPKIREVRALLEADPTWRGRMFETHPELCFARLNEGDGVEAAKKTPAGRATRLRLLATVFGRTVVDRALRTAKGAKGVANDDKIDAMAALVAALRAARSDSNVLPSKTKGQSKTDHEAEPRITF